MQLCDGHLMFRKMVYILGIVRILGCVCTRCLKVFLFSLLYLKVFYSLIELSESFMLYYAIV